MLYTETVEPLTLAVLKELMQKSYLEQFVLVGGTALALQIGHRKSVDLDLFTTNDFQSENLMSSLVNDFELTTTFQMPQTIICTIKEVKVDFIRFRYPLIRPIIEIEGIRMLSIEDIAPMKLDAITGRGDKKDFYDLYYLLKTYSLTKLLELYTEKFQHQTTFHVIRSLTYFVDAEEMPNPDLIDKNITWQEVKNTIVNAIQEI